MIISKRNKRTNEDLGPGNGVQEETVRSGTENNTKVTTNTEQGFKIVNCKQELTSHKIQ